MPKTKTAPTKTPAASLPSWLTHTPWRPEYCLEMTDTDGQSADSVEMSREEYLVLKVLLARLRGIDVPLVRPEDVPDSTNAVCAQALWDEPYDVLEIVSKVCAKPSRKAA